MITSPTVFVLGAGASAVYGFPVGQRLCELVQQDLAIPVRTRQLLLDTAPVSEGELDAFRRELLLSAASSVDAFLEHRPEFLQVGKAAMAALLVKYEQAPALWSYVPENWMRYLFNALRCKFEEFRFNQVSFVTFNYDRSLERFFLTTLCASYGKDIGESGEVLSHIPMIHLHGKLGNLPHEGGACREYDVTLDAHGMKFCMDGIKVVHEDITEGRDKEFNQAKELLRNANRTYYLGFGFGQTNVQRLGITELKGGGLATGVGLTMKECMSIKDLVKGKVDVHPGIDCIGLLRNFAKLN